MDMMELSRDSNGSGAFWLNVAWFYLRGPSVWSWPDRIPVTNGSELHWNIESVQVCWTETGSGWCFTECRSPNSFFMTNMAELSFMWWSLFLFILYLHSSCSVVCFITSFSPPAASVIVHHTQRSQWNTACLHMLNMKMWWMQNQMCSVQFHAIQLYLYSTNSQQSSQVTLQIYFNSF